MERQQVQVEHGGNTTTAVGFIANCSAGSGPFAYPTSRTAPSTGATAARNKERLLTTPSLPVNGTKMPTLLPL
jgi:hypothetical protein